MNRRRYREDRRAAQAAPESFQGDGAVAAVEMAAPLAPVAELAAPAEKGLSVTVTQETEVAVAKAKAPALRESAIAPQAAGALEAQDDSGTAAPVAAMAEAESTPPPPVAALAGAEVENVIESELSSLPTVVALTAPEKPTEPALAAQEFSREIPGSQGTSMLWRILEGLAAIAVLGFLGSWLLRRRSTR